jgi:hypothetical protein
VQAPCLEQSLVRRDSSCCKLDNRSTINIAKTDRSASPDALCMPPCSISTVQSGRCCRTCAAACFASSMLLTITNDFVALGSPFLGSRRDRSEMGEGGGGGFVRVNGRARGQTERVGCTNGGPVFLHYIERTQGRAKGRGARTRATNEEGGERGLRCSQRSTCSLARDRSGVTGYITLHR